MASKIENRELKLAEKDILVGKYKTALEKSRFINDIKSGLGDKIKSNPDGIKIIKKTFAKKMFNLLKNIFNKF